MDTGEYTRKLAAILSADVEGYSRLMEADELDTIATLKKHRSVIETLVNGYRGRVVDAPGDNILAEFASVMDAVRCAFDIQKELSEKNSRLPQDKRMRFRIGINIGDVIQEGGKIYGDGVNIAARVEGLAEAGGICISGTVYEHIRHKLAIWDEFIGMHTVKNISDPISVYRIYPGGKPKTKKSAKSHAKSFVLAGTAALVILLALTLVFLNQKKDAVVADKTDSIVTTTEPDLQKTELVFDGKRIDGEWHPYAKPPATSSLHVNQNGQVIWIYAIPETDEDIYTGIDFYIDSMSISGRRVDIAIDSESGRPLEMRFYAFVSGFSKQGDEDTLVPGETILQISPGAQSLTIDETNLEVPWWWRKEKGNKDVAFSSNDIRTIEFGAVVDKEAGPVSDRIVIQSIRIE